MLPDSSLVFGSFSFQRCVTAADSIGPGVANATEHKQVLKSDYGAFEDPLQYGPAKKRVSRRNLPYTKTTNLQGQTRFLQDPLCFVPPPSAGFPSPDAAPITWTGAETYLEVFR